ncbi:hypothetical protein DB30_07966 [Enhygromyxa salina]|uniref:Uncharacterized protein n=1 Tax=Enhygromyxa salina TaxID=215803 RepID=A0A0C1ZR79_9BACT|nr:hypothetical protein [Enhygromyxa salina]KIG13518.1 hypothetical protein DB30_07966 [Enhygromyxa salina]
MLALAVFEREALLRPLRAELKLTTSDADHGAELELALDSSGAWRADNGSATGADAAALAAELDRLKPSSIRVRADASTPASVVVNLLRVPDVWSARARRQLELTLLITDDT